MNKHLHFETGECSFEKRGHKSALENFAFDVYVETKVRLLQKVLSTIWGVRAVSDMLRFEKYDLYAFLCFACLRRGRVGEGKASMFLSRGKR